MISQTHAFRPTFNASLLLVSVRQNLDLLLKCLKLAWDVEKDFQNDPDELKKRILDLGDRKA